MKRTVIIAAIGILTSGCSLLEQVQQMQTFAHCKFRLAGVSQTRLAGVSIQGKTSIKQFGMMDAIVLTAAVKSGKLPLQFVLDVEVQNPNPRTAAMNRLAWILIIDGVEMTRGQLDRRVEIAANGGVAPLPLEISLDLKQALSGQSGDAMLNLAFNVAGEGTRPTHVTLKVKPSVLVGEQTLDLPDYITISTEFGGGAGQP